jgi:hypothetical protein
MEKKMSGNEEGVPKGNTTDPHDGTTLYLDSVGDHMNTHLCDKITQNEIYSHTQRNACKLVKLECSQCQFSNCDIILRCYKMITLGKTG